MGRVDELATRYRNHISTPWQRNLAGKERIIFLVYPKADERKLRARLELFEIATVGSGFKWKTFEFTHTFSRWMSELEYKDIYFEEPENLAMPLESDFVQFAANELKEALTDKDVDSETVVAMHGIASLYGFAKVSRILQEVADEIRGRLLVFFPGEFENNNYRLLDARDGWNYLAVPITLHNGVSD